MQDANECRLTGTVEKIKPVTTKTGAAMTELILRVRRDSFPVVGHGNVAEHLLASCGPGDRLNECPAMEKATRPTVPSWCNTHCDHFHKLVVPDLGTVPWCCQEEDSTHWRRLRIDAMNSCPMEEKS